MENSPINLYNDPALMQAQGASQQASQAYSQAVTNSSTMPDMLKRVLDKKFSTNNPLYAEREDLYKNYMNENTAAPMSVLPENNDGMVFSPLAQSQMIEGRRAGALAPITSVNDILGWQIGGIQNTVGEATKMYETLAKAKQFEAERKRQAYEDLLALVESKVAQANSDRDFAENVRQFNVGESNDASGDAMSPFEEALLEKYFGGGETANAPTEEKPTTKPRSGVDILGRKTTSGRTYHSPQGQWVFDYQSNDWVPVID